MKVLGDDNVVLVGMPGAGKSTVGVLLAKVMGRPFMDTDVSIQVNEGRRLQEIIDHDGLDVFRALEERYVLATDCSRHVIATGGSVVYSEPAMNHLKAKGVVVYLDLPMARLRARLKNLQARGVVMMPGQSLDGLYLERAPLYHHYADVVVPCEGLNHEGVVGRILEGLGGR
jgi:shikimate kinase